MGLVLVPADHRVSCELEVSHPCSRTAVCGGLDDSDMCGMLRDARTSDIGACKEWPEC